jgi:hypothetical protein
MPQLDPHTTPFKIRKCILKWQVSIFKHNKQNMNDHVIASLPLYHSPCTIQQSVFVHQIQHMYGNPATIESEGFDSICGLVLL